MNINFRWTPSRLLCKFREVPEHLSERKSWVIAAILICGISTFTAYAICDDNNPIAYTNFCITPSQSRVGYSSWGTQVSYTHCDPLPKTGKPEIVSGSWEMNDGILQHTAREEAPLAICNYVIPSDHYSVQCQARKDSGPEGFIIVFNYVDPQNYCLLNFGTNCNTQHAIEQKSSDGRIQMAARPGCVKTGKWYDVRLTVAGDSIKAWLDGELIFDEVFKQTDK